MPQAVFLRGANVGGRNVFQPSAVARHLAALEVVSIGAAGTFGVRAKASDAAVHAAFMEALPFSGEVMIVPSDELLAIWRSGPFGRRAHPSGTEPFFTVLAKAPSKPTKLPFARPSEDDWQIRVIKRSGRFVFSLRRARLPGRFYPNDVIEKEFQVPATTRSWATIVALCRALESA
jgi:uncharacterized protein (DUF1697 family)